MAERSGECRCCCQGPATIYGRISDTTGGGACAACLDGSCLQYNRIDTPAPGCVEWNYTGTLCGIAGSNGEIVCCMDGCLNPLWAMGTAGKLIVSSGTLQDGWTCDPFFQVWTGCIWHGIADCVGQTFTVTFSEVPCP